VSAARVTVAELEQWDARIRDVAGELGLTCYPQEFELCDHAQMLGTIAYSGMPSHYPHWSYGKAYEKLKTLYDYGVSGLPYELVINSDPCLAYLMRDNPLGLQILTIAHVYGHNDFFRNNFTFRATGATRTLATFKLHADRVRDYIEDPSIGLDQVETVLDAAHALALQCRRNQAVARLEEPELRRRQAEAARPPRDPFRAIHPPAAPYAPPAERVPAEPEADLLPFIRDHNPRLADWERDLLTIVHEQARYFLPQIETKIMNEGWASYWHRTILNRLELPPDLQFEFMVNHNLVLAPQRGQVNPYHLGLAVWDHIEQRYDAAQPDADAADDLGRRSGRDKLFEVRRSDRDTSFLRRFLDEELARELDLFQHQARGDERVVSRVADSDDWREIKQTLLQNVGLGQVPVIQVVDADFGGARTLHLAHEHDGRDLQLEYARKTLEHLQRLWGRAVQLDTVVDGEPLRFGFDGNDFSSGSVPR
jgi:stage V sporulation protein R